MSHHGSEKYVTSRYSKVCHITVLKSMSLHGSEKYVTSWQKKVCQITIVKSMSHHGSGADVCNQLYGYQQMSEAFHVSTVGQRKKVTAVTFFSARPRLDQTAQIRAKYAKFPWMKSRDFWCIE